MNDEERKLDYKKSANEFWRWILSGEQILQASNCLDIEYNKTLHNRELLAPMIFLRAISLENFLKGLYIKYEKSALNEKGILIFKYHKLSDLYKDILDNLSDEKKDVLNKLEDAISFWGRYPVPRKYDQWRKEINTASGTPPIFMWSDKDSEVYLEILHEVRNALADETKGQQSPEWFL